MTKTPEHDFWADRTVLVTGVYGFLASHLAESLLSMGNRVVGLYRDRPAESYLQIEGLEDSVTLVPGDIRNIDDCKSAIATYSCSMVFHLAAQSLVGVANRNPTGTFETNIGGTWRILDAARQLNETDPLVEALVVASSDKAYGDQPDLPYREDNPLLGMYPYDASKACADLLSRTYHNTYDLPVSVTRCGNLFGPGDLNFSRLVPDTIQAVVGGENPVIRSDGSPKRDYLYVKDAADGYLSLARMTAKGPAAGKAYNFGSGEPLSVLQMVQQIIKVSGQENIEPDIQGSSWGEIKHQYLDANKAKQQLGWEPQTPMDTALAETYRWYSNYLSV